MLVVFGGLPGTGKTTISRELARRRSATFLRIDVVEQTLRFANVLAGDVGPAGYIIANALTASNLSNGQTVIVDCVNPVHESRRGWRSVAERAGVVLVEVEVICSDLAEHRRRVETRTSDIDGLVLPGWQAVLSYDYSDWVEPHLVVDTALLTADQATKLVEQRMEA